MATKRQSKLQKRNKKLKQQANRNRKLEKRRRILARKFLGFGAIDAEIAIIDVSDIEEPETIMGGVLQRKHVRRTLLFKKF